ncbi:hypothetical protein BL247_12645 [Ralstonia solanacearum]|nr:hypothetical protein AC251_22255 [Ralstonia pseudosolanacearum]OIN72220.1 hypothetical protein BL247_12645 [Ralstonia solanacearum]OIT16678.1 hypothetical protein BL243_10160 [Ralstonia solanacearum]
MHLICRLHRLSLDTECKAEVIRTIQPLLGHPYASAWTDGTGMRFLRSINRMFRKGDWWGQQSMFFRMADCIGSVPRIAIVSFEIDSISTNGCPI